MAEDHVIIPPATLGGALRPLKDFTRAEFDALASAVEGPRSFSLSTDELTALTQQLTSRSANITFLLGALAFLYSQVARVVKTGMAYEDAIAAVVEDLDADAEWGEKKDEVRNRFARLLRDRDSHRHFRKVQRLRSGFIPNAVGFSSFVDLRPDFGDADELDLKEFIPIIQFRVLTDSPGVSSKRMVFQLSEEALSELRKAIDRTESKLASLRAKSGTLLPIAKS